MAEVRQRKANASDESSANDAPPTPEAVSDDSKKTAKKSDTTTPPPAEGYDTGILNVALAVGTILVFTFAAIGLAIYLLDPLQHLDLDNIIATTAASSTVAKPSSQSSSPSDSTSEINNNNNNNLRTFTPRTLAPYTGTDPDLPIYLALNGTVYDVSSGRAFYGPSGPYGHFAGRDATRAWVTECFGQALTPAERDDPDLADSQLTPSLAGVERMFMPLWLDEALQDAADGGPVGDDVAVLFPGAKGVTAGTVLPDAVRGQAAKLLERMGRVGEREREERREEDAREAREGLERALGKWVGFFAGGGKYAVVGTMVFDEEASDGDDVDGLEERDEDEERGDLPPLCEAAKKKRPIKGGRLEPVMGMMQKMMGAGAGAGDAAAAAAAAGAGAGAAQGRGEMPDFVKQMLEKREREKKGKN